MKVWAIISSSIDAITSGTDRCPRIRRAARTVTAGAATRRRLFSTLTCPSVSALSVPSSTSMGVVANDTSDPHA